MITNLPRVLIASFTLTLAACAAGPDVSSGSASMQVLAQDDRYALVRLQRGQDMADVAAAYLGDPGEVWQLFEVNANRGSTPGQVVAVPLKPTNSSSIYVDGFRTLPIVCYHQFTDKNATRSQLEITAKAFEAQMQYLLENHFRILSFADAEQIIRQGQPIPDRAIVITIDDGYRSVYDIAWPILKKHNIKATLFVYTDFIGGSKALSWAQMKEMKDSGLIEIESHAKSHTSLSRLPEDKDSTSYQSRVTKEVRGSAQVFRKHLGSPPRYLSYPYGNTSTTAAGILRREGYGLAATVTRGNNTSFSDPYFLHRTMIYDTHDLKKFTEIVRGYKQKSLQ